MSDLLLSLAVSPLFAQTGNQTNSVSWGIVIFCVFLGMTVTLASSRRTTEVKRSKHE